MPLSLAQSWMPDWTDASLYLVVLIAVLLINAVGVWMVIVQLPGTWVILGATSLAAYLRWEQQTIGMAALVALLVLALLGELVELLGSAAGAGKAGASRRGALGALLGGVIGAILGLAIPIPLIGSIIGACIGAAVGSALGDRWAGRTWEQVRLAARGAAMGKFWGTIAKVAIAVVMWLFAALVLLWP